MKKTMVCCLLFSLLPTFGEESSCSSPNTIDNRIPTFYDAENSRHLMRDQGMESEWCYSFAAADLITHHLYRNNRSQLTHVNGDAVPREEQFVSPLSALSYRAVAQNRNRGNESFNRVTASGAVNQELIDLFSNRNMGTCLESEVNSSNVSTSKDYKAMQLSVMMNQLEDIYSRPIDENSNNALCEAWTNTFSEFLPTLKFKEFNKIIIDSFDQGSARHQMMSNLIQASCKHPLPLEDLPPVTVVQRHIYNDNADKIPDGDNSREFLNSISTQLNEGDIVSLHYNGYYLQNIDGGVGKNGNELVTTHLSSIVGMRCTDGKTNYLIRNSFGPTCEIYDDRLDCEEGNIWVSEELLLKMSSAMSYL